MQFESCKNGYNKEEVESEVSRLTSELATWKERALKAESDYIKLKERENEIKKSSENISLALTAAVEKAKQIENSSRNVYKLKIQQISILYDRWEMLLNEILEKNPSLEESQNIQKMICDFKKSIESIVSQEYQITPKQTDSNSDVMRSLLSKMSRYNTNLPRVEKIERNDLTSDLKTGQSELKRIEEKVMIKPISNLTLEKNDSYETLADKFLKGDVEENPQYTQFMSKQINCKDYPTPNESGFDLKEAVNPKEDLDEIMKSFDFFTSDSKDTKN